MKKDDLKGRTFKFSIDLVELLPKYNVTRVISYQILKGGTSVGASYHAAKRASEEAKKWIKDKIQESHIKEANELTDIFTSTLKIMNQRSSNF